MERVKALKRAFEEKGFEGFLISNETNLLYFTGFPGATSLLISKNDENTIYVHNVNYEQAKAEGEGFVVELLKPGENFIERTAAQAKISKITKLAVDTLTLDSYLKLKKRIESIKIEMQDKLVWELRKIKDEKELKLMRKAAQLTCKGMKVAYEVIKPGMREYEAAAEIEYAMRKKGSSGAAFDTIVASGARSAFPHGGCTERSIRQGDLVVVDMGASYHYYRSDMTRTIVAGKPSAKQARIYEIVEQAQEKAFQSVRSKVKARKLDDIARKLIEKAGYGDYFVHGLGHGVGLEVHEPPTLNQKSTDLLDVGNVVTIEPGIYMLGFGGFRVEDTILVHKSNGERLTKGFNTLTTRK